MMLFSLLSSSSRRPVAAAVASTTRATTSIMIGAGRGSAVMHSSPRQFTIVASQVGHHNNIILYQQPHHHQQQQPQQQQQLRSFGNKKIIDIRRSEQRTIWSAYLTGSISEKSLFTEIDLNKSGTISVEEINYFLDSVDRSGVNPTKFDLLQQLGSDHLLDEREFHRWLCMAIDVKNDGSDFVISEDSSSSSSSSDSSDDDDESTSSTTTASATASPPPKKKVVDARRGLQEIVWETFLTTGTNASDLFKMIDLNRSSKISVSEIDYFMTSIGKRGVSHDELVKLQTLGADHELDEEEFYRWLSDATGVELNDDGEVEHVSSVRDDGAGCTPAQW